MFAATIEALRSLAAHGRGRSLSLEDGLPEDAHAFACPVCDGPMLVRGEERIEEPPVRVRDLECEACGMVCDRIYDPVRGYDRRIVL